MMISTRAKAQFAALIWVMVVVGPVRAFAAEEPAWVKDWTVLLPEFSTAIGACVEAAQAKPGWVNTHWVRRVGPMNRGLGLVALQTADGKIVECAADLTTGQIQRLEVSGDPAWAEAGGKALYVVPPSDTNDACDAEPIDEGNWIGWLIDRNC
ncbi:hypothetical protein [Hoeflea sp. TYP-13]|uniref:hypothetical protein n=1 Tax=Hoeflea sp. TYP-13 TaxID=3230023 RepID=UPI0034C66FEA